MQKEFQIKFEGLIADGHQLPMGQLGKSLVGIDRIVNTGLIFLSYGRGPKRGERFDLVVAAKEPQKGSVSIVAVLQQVPWVLPIVQDFLITGGVDASYRFFSFVTTRFGGRPKEAEMHLNALLQMNRDHLDSRDRSEQQWQNTLLHVVDRLAPAMVQAVEPIGSDASQMAISGPNPQLKTEIDEPMADAIRSKENDEVGDMQKMKIQVDGFIHHSKQLKINHPDIEGRFITADVRDPSFDSVPNVYTNAASSAGSLNVMAKPIYRAGVLQKIYIMDLASD